MTVFDLTEIQADYILDMPLRRLTKFSRIELEKEQSELQTHDRGARRDPRRRRAAAQGRLRRARRGRQDLRHPAPHGAAGVGRHRRRHRRRAARGRRRPVLRPACPPPGCWPAPPPPSRRARAATRANHDVVVSAVRDHGPRRGRRGDQPRPGGQARRARPAGAARLRQRPPPARRPAAQPGRHPGPGRAGALPDHASPATAPAWRSAPATASSSGSTPRCSARTTGR